MANYTVVIEVSTRREDDSGAVHESTKTIQLPLIVFADENPQSKAYELLRGMNTYDHSWLITDMVLEPSQLKLDQASHGN